MIQGIQDIVKVKGKPKLVSEVVEINPEIKNTICSLCEDRLRRIFTDFSHDKLSRDDAVKELRTEVLEKIKAELPEYAEATNEVFNSVTKEVFRNLILETSIRCVEYFYGLFYNLIRLCVSLSKTIK